MRARQSPRILVFAGSARAQSFNGRLAALFARTLALREAEVRLISLADYPLPLYDGDLEAERGVPEAAAALFELMIRHQGIFIASPEYNQSVTPLIKNTIDWVSRIRPGDGAPSPWRKRVFALGAASPGYFAGTRALLHLRQILELALGATVLAEQVALPAAVNAFDPMGSVTNDKVADQIERLAGRLIEEAARFA